MKNLTKKLVIGAAVLGSLAMPLKGIAGNDVSKAEVRRFLSKSKIIKLDKGYYQFKDTNEGRIYNFVNLMNGEIENCDDEKKLKIMGSENFRKLYIKYVEHLNKGIFGASKIFPDLNGNGKADYSTW